MRARTSTTVDTTPTCPTPGSRNALDTDVRYVGRGETYRFEVRPAPGREA